MSRYEITAQIIGIIAMMFNVLSYQGKKQKTVITLQLLGSTFFAVNYFMLGAIVGSISNLVTVFRAIVFLNKKKLKADSPLWLVFYICSYVAVYVLNFTVFGKDPTVFNILLELLPVVGGVALSVGYFLKSASSIRKAGLVSSPSWLVYNIIVGSWGATLCEIFTLISIFVGMFVNDRKKR